MPRWFNLRTVLPLAAFLAVIIALVAADLATGDEGRQADLALSTPVTPLPTQPPTATLPPGVEPTATPSPTPDASANVRNDQRHQDLLRLADAFLRYAEDHQGEFPDTNGALQSICVYKELDKGCVIGDYIDPIPVDPAQPTDALKNGYWWSSHPQTLILYAVNEGAEEDSDGCPAQRPANLQKIKDGLTCLVVRAP